MIHIRPEGEEIRYGLNLYPKNDKFNKGFLIRLNIGYGDLHFRWRFSVSQQKHLINWNFVNKQQILKQQKFMRRLDGAQ